MMEPAVNISRCMYLDRSLTSGREMADLVPMKGKMKYKDPETGHVITVKIGDDAPRWKCLRKLFQSKNNAEVPRSTNANAPLTFRNHDYSNIKEDPPHLVDQHPPSDAANRGEINTGNDNQEHVYANMEIGPIDTRKSWGEKRKSDGSSSDSDEDHYASAWDIHYAGLK